MGLSNDGATKGDAYAWLALASLNFQSAQAALGDRRKVGSHCAEPGSCSHALAAEVDLGSIKDTRRFVACTVYLMVG